MSDSAAGAGVVLPLDPQAAELAQEDPWRLLAEGRGLLVSWTDASHVDHAWTGPGLRAGSALGNQLATILAKADQSRALSAGETLFRLQLPTGSTLQDLVPAVGGGFRGMVRTADSVALKGHARLFPVAGATAAGVALGPLVGLMALSVGAEMLARHQQDQKLDAIRQGVESLVKAADEQTRAQLDTGEQALESASAAILDRIDVPSAIGLGPARNNVRDIKNRGLRWLAEYEQRLEEAKPHKRGIDFGVMRDVLGGKDSGDAYKRFPDRVETIYRALALDSRAIVLTGAEAALGRDDQTFDHLQEQLQGDLRKNAAVQDRLRDLLLGLVAEPLDFSLPSMPDTGTRVAQLERRLRGLANAASRLPDAPAMLDASNRQVTEILRKADGSLRVLTPREDDRNLA